MDLFRRAFAPLRGTPTTTHNASSRDRLLYTAINPVDTPVTPATEVTGVARARTGKGVDPVSHVPSLPQAIRRPNGTLHFDSVSSHGSSRLGVGASSSLPSSGAGSTESSPVVSAIGAGDELLRRFPPTSSLNGSDTPEVALLLGGGGSTLTHAPPRPLRESSDDSLYDKLAGGPPSHNQPRSKADLVRWCVYGFALACVAYYFVAAPWMRQGHFLGNASTTTGGYDVADGLTRFQAELVSDTAPTPSSALVRTDGGVGSHAMAVSGASCTTCSFRFPRPPAGSASSSFFVTAVPNHGAGVGHQFSEWVTGPYLAQVFNMTYVHTSLLLQSQRWNVFLGLGEGEDTVEDLYTSYGGVAQVETADYPPGNDGFKTFSIYNWTRDTLERVRNEPTTLRIASEVDTTRLTTAQQALTPGLPYPVLLQAHMIAVPAYKVVCEPTMYRTIRQKYCAARIRNPVREDLYAADRRDNKIVITWHLRCGDECFSYYRATPFDSIVATSFKLSRLFASLEPKRQLSFHFFSQDPLNGTAEDHFAPLMKRLEPLDTHTHWKTKSPAVLHHLITSDVLFGAFSGFSWLAFLHHNGVSLGTIPGCVDTIAYDKFTGEFNDEQFQSAWAKYKDHVPKYRTFQDCIDMK